MPWTCTGSCWESCWGSTSAFPRLNQLRFIARDPILTGILKVTKLPVQSTFWRFVNALHLNVARQIADHHANHARTGLGGGQCEVGGRHHRHRHHGAHALRPADGRTQELQPEEQRQEELPADADVHRRDAGIRLGRIAQRRPAHGQTDWRSHTECVRGPAAGREADLRPGRFGVLLPGSGRGLRRMQRPVRDLSAQDVPAGRATAPGRVEAVEQDGCRMGV